ncbi:MAG TPA: HDOD domain-containing protein [Bryobacteraceae bacterium]|nr:HDOD domain-containing protein [Bryobacteraceae bacterium]
MIAKFTDPREQALRTLGNLPPFSPILNRLLATLANEDVSFGKLSDLIEKDPVMAGNMLRLVNSALYARRGTINSVRHAVALLGINKLRNAVLGMSISRMWKNLKTPPDWSSARFNLHSVAVAVLSDLLAQRLPVVYPEGAFVSGLFHDLGRLLIAVGLPEAHQEICRLYQQGSRTLLDCEEEVLGLTHPQLSAEALAIWNLPEPIRTAVAQHHNPPPKTGEFQLAHLLEAANHYINHSGVTIATFTSVADTPYPEKLEALGLAEAMPALLEDFKVEYESLAGFFK